MKMRAKSRRTAVAVLVVVAGLAVMAVALVGGSDSPRDSNAGRSANQKIDPIRPINPKDEDARQPVDEDDEVIDPSDVFGTSYGADSRREVTVKVSADGYVGIWVYYRDRKKPQSMSGPTFTQTREVKGRLPIATVVMQIPGTLQGVATRATCTIVIDGTEVSRESTRKPWALKSCVG